MRIQFLIFTLIILFSACLNKSNKLNIRIVTFGEPPERRAFINFWKGFSVKFDSHDTAAVSTLILDSVWLWGDKISSKEFIQRYRDGYSSVDFVGILDTTKTKYSSIGCHPSPPIKEAIKRQYSNSFNCDQVLVIQDTVGSIVNGIEFTFLQTSKGHRLFGIKYFSSYWRYDNAETDTTALNQ
jgi:hypothetical protein